MQLDINLEGCGNKSITIRRSVSETVIWRFNKTRKGLMIEPDNFKPLIFDFKTDGIVPTICSLDWGETVTEILFDKANNQDASTHFRARGKSSPNLHKIY